MAHFFASINSSFLHIQTLTNIFLIIAGCRTLEESSGESVTNLHRSMLSITTFFNYAYPGLFAVNFLLFQKMQYKYKLIKA